MEGWWNVCAEQQRKSIFKDANPLLENDFREATLKAKVFPLPALPFPIHCYSPFSSYPLAFWKPLQHADENSCTISPLVPKALEELQGIYPRKMAIYFRSF